MGAIDLDRPGDGMRLAYTEADDVTPVVLVHSWGAFIAPLAAIREPEQEPPVLQLFVGTPPAQRLGA